MGVNVSELFKAIPQKLFDKASAKCPVDRHNNKLTGQTLFKVLLYNLCEDSSISLRTISKSFERHQFLLYHNGRKLTASKSGIADRLKTIDYRYYEQLFFSIRDYHYGKIPEKFKSRIKIFDSTSITLSSKLLKHGFKTSQGDYNQIKCSVGFDSFPHSVHFGVESKDNSENVSLKTAIQSASFSKNDIVVFDRGINSRKVFQELQDAGIKFVTRLNETASYELIKENELQEIESDEIELLQDCMVKLKNKAKVVINTELRLIKVRSHKHNKVLVFLSNLTDIDDFPASEIAGIYKKRWDIEVFFKFMKQHLHVKHFLSRDLNGIKVVCYIILITALLILLFKELNGIGSFKEAKIMFTDQLRSMLTYEIIVLHNHDPCKLSKFFDL